jgi:hypothetical protein
MNRTWIIMGLVSGVLSVSASAQDAPQTPADPPPADVLSGPKVKETQAERTLVKRDFRGRVQRLEAHPAEAAVELLIVDQPTKAKVSAVVDERTATLDRLVRDNLELLLKFQNTPDRRGRLALLREAGALIKELDAKGTLEERIKPLLPKDQATRFDELIAGYWDTIVADAQQEGRNGEGKPDAKTPSKTPGRTEILTREKLQAFGAEVKRSYERQIAAKTKELEAFLGKLGLSPEKETTIRNVFTDSFQKTGGKPTPQQRRELGMKVFRELDREQQRLLLKELFSGSDAAPADATPENPDPMQDSPGEMMPMDTDKK